MQTAFQRESTDSWRGVLRDLRDRGLTAPVMVAERRFRRLDAPAQLAAVYDGRKFTDGKLVKEKKPPKAAA